MKAAVPRLDNGQWLFIRERLTINFKRGGVA